MDLAKLTAFLAVADERNFGRAAQRLHMTPSPLSRQVAQLERELGGALFVREYHRVALTPMGEALVGPVRRILEQAGELPAIAAQARGEVRPLRVAATAWAPTARVTRFAEAVGRTGGESASGLELVEDSDDVVPGLLDGRLDLALLHLPAPDSDGGLSAVPWLRYPLAVAVRADDPLAGRESVSLAELSGRTFVESVIPPRVTNAMRRVSTMLKNARVTRTEQVQGAPGGVEISREVLLRGLATFVPHLPGSPLPSLMSPPAFATIPVEDEGFGMDVGLVWCAEQVGRRPDTARRVEEAVEALTGAPLPAGAPVT
ncbi:LysR family transcriptional regulator [Streptomyces mexicanus]|uniref:LysR family transcriptional regulator n=1 Tax=Streptomyces mexicanus TaxID=178566 RepID=UPI00135ADE8A|nr:LysR family transcriptional regulator [Streptomyces mexicanus]